VSNQTRNRVAELKRPSSDFPRRYVPQEVDFSLWEDIEPLFERLLDRPLNDCETVEKWLLDLSELSSVVSEEGSRRYIAMTCATDDTEAEKAYLHFIENIEPKMKPVSHQLDVKLLDCPHTAELDHDRYRVLLRNCRNAVELFRAENVPLETELDILSQQYQKIMGGMTVQFQGQERTLQQMGVFLQENDRSLRNDAWQVSTDRRLQETERFDDIYDKMLELRAKTAENAGFKDFRDYQFRRYNRFDYTPEDCINFHQAVEKYVVPVTKQSTEKRRKALAVETIRPWDTACDRYGRTPLRPFEATDKLAGGCREIFTRIDPWLGEQFQRMIDLGLLDLDSRKGKAPGGYQSSLSEVRLPFIFMNAVGINRDLYTLLHEGGHAFHQFAVSGEPLLAYRHAPMEFSEVASMSMEKLGAQHLEVFYDRGEASRARYDAFEGDIALLSWIAIIDAFQHWIYTHPGHSREERSAQFVGLMERFGSGVDWTSCEEAMRYRWQAQLHIFGYPFYYIEYGIAQLGALQVWRNSRRDLPGAIEAYKAALKLGGSRTLPELFEAAETEFDFTERTIQPLTAEVQEEIERQAAMESK